MTVFLAICLIVLVTLALVALSGGARDRGDEAPLPELKPTVTPLPGRYPAARGKLQNPALLAAARGVERARP